MKRFKYIYTVLIATAAIVLGGCKPEAQPVKSNKVVEFTIRTSDVFHDGAIISVKHNGPEDITWYGFITEDLTTYENVLYMNKRRELQRSGKVEGIRKETERNILLENLKENTTYKYIVFGIKEDGSAYENVGFSCIKFTTIENIYNMTLTEGVWEFEYLGRTADQKQDIIKIKANGGGAKFGFNYVSKEAMDEFEKQYPDGFEIWDENDLYMATVDGKALFALEQISTIQYYVTKYNYKLEDLTYSNEETLKIDRLTSGEYYLIAYGFNNDASHTRKYGIHALKIEEETATDGYNKWLGNYTFSGEVEIPTDEDGVMKTETRTYNMFIEKYDNNFMYRVHGWECGEDVEYDWEEDITQIDKEKGQFFAFPAYYDYLSGNLSIQEQPITYITFDGVTSLKLGIYGYAYSEDAKEEVPVLYDGNEMATAAPIADGSMTTILYGTESLYEYTDDNNQHQSIDLKYSRMGYIAYDDSVIPSPWQTLNPAMKFPITITKTDEDHVTGGNIQTGNTPAVSNLSLFGNSKKISADFLKKDYKPADKINSSIFRTIR